MRHLIIICMALPGLLLGDLKAQSIPSEYLETALNNNLVLKEKKVGLDKSLLALKEARSLFLPTTWLEGQYTLANGGRTIDIPVGDLMNPVYQTLNQLTSSNKFPQIGNVSEQFLPNNFYDLRVKTTMPIINPEIRLNSAIKQQQSALQQNEVAIYRRELVKEVKTAYYNYVMAQQAVLIYQHSLEVVKQNLRVNQSLLNNGKGLPAYVTRAESEVQSIESSWQNAITNEENARAYFNFLLNRPLAEAIKVAHKDSADLDTLIAATASMPGSTSSREELQTLQTAKQINRLAEKMNRSFRVPRVNAFLDLASQGFDFNMNNKTLFYLGGVQMQVPLFTGRRNLYKIDQSRYDAAALSLQEEHVQKQLDLSAYTSRNKVYATYNTWRSSLKQQQSAQQYFRLIDKGYREGVNSFIEYLDARNQLTQSQLQYNINYYKVLTAFAEYERQTASFSFK